MPETAAGTISTDPMMKVIQFIYPGIFTAQAIYVVAKLGIADLIAKGHTEITELAQMTQAHATTLHRVLRVLTAFGLFVEGPPGVFQNSPCSETLRQDRPESARAFVLLLSLYWKALEKLDGAVRTGRPAFDLAYGQRFFEYIAAHPDDAAIFNQGMTGGTSAISESLLAAYNFSQFERIVDVGGGEGEFLHRILSTNLKPQGVLYDLPTVVAGASALRAGDIGARSEVIGGDFFDSVPGNADAYILKNVVHDWQDEEALTILTNCRRAIKPQGVLLLIEAIQDTSADPGFMDLVMLVLGGMERSEPQFRSLLTRAAFSVNRILPANGLFIIECQPAAVQSA